MADAIAGLRQIAASIRAMARRDEIAIFDWATVKSVTPLTVALDQDDTHTPREVAANAAGPVQVGDRVHVLKVGRVITLASDPAAVARLIAATQPVSARGRETITIATAAAGTTKTVTLPAGMFTTAPIVHLTKAGAGLAKYIPYATATTTQLTIGLYAGDGTAATGTVDVSWTATRP